MPINPSRSPHNRLGPTSQGHRNGQRSVMPSNHGSVDTAKNSIRDIAPIHTMRVHNAFRVNNYCGLFYSKLRTGLRCHCNATFSNTNLNPDGTATPGFMDEQLLGDHVGIDPYNYRKPSPRIPVNTLGQINEANVDGQPLLEPVPRNPYSWSISQEALAYDQDPLVVPAEYEKITPTVSHGSVSAMNDSFSTHPDQGDTILSSGLGATGPVDIDQEGFMEDVPIVGSGNATFSACPVCMGTSYVGGYAVQNGFRLVMNFQHPGAFLPMPVDFSEQVPAICVAPGGSTPASFTVTLPAHVRRIDALRVWDGTSMSPADVSVDGALLTQQHDLLRYCDGRMHTITVTPHSGRFTHIELQGMQGEDNYWALPNLTRGDIGDKLDTTEPFEAFLSPVVPHVQPGDVFTDTAHNKTLAIGSVTGKSHSSRAILGWTAQVRVVQPRELLRLLPCMASVTPYAPAASHPAPHPYAAHAALRVNRDPR